MKLIRKCVLVLPCCHVTRALINVFNVVGGEFNAFSDTFSIFFYLEKSITHRFPYKNISFIHSMFGFRRTTGYILSRPYVRNAGYGNYGLFTIPRMLSISLPIFIKEIQHSLLLGVYKPCI